MNWLAITVGAVLVLAVLRDIFHSVGHPEGRGSLSRLILTTAWRLSRYRGGRSHLARLVGPLALLAVIIVWGTLVVIGWALLYWPFVPDEFVYASTDHNSSILDALYLSLVTISTLGFGDIVPSSGWLRIATPLEAVFGFALLTVAVSWVVQIYPALNRRRVLAIRLTLLRRADTLDRLGNSDSAMVAGLLESLATGIVQVRVDLTQYSETYFFRDTDPDTALAATLGYAMELGRVGALSKRADVRLAAAILACALEELTRVLDAEFLHVAGTVPEVVNAYAADHGHGRSRTGR